MPLRIGDPIPSFDGATSWLNVDAGSASPESGRPLLVHFWAISCYVCKNNFPALRELLRRYQSVNLQTIAVHMPRQEEDTRIEAVQQSISEFGIAEPCAIDNEHSLKDAFKNDQGWVPVYFLFDSEGNLRARSAGEAGISMLATSLERLFPSNGGNAAG